jgi:serine/threonine protein kinase
MPSSESLASLGIPWTGLPRAWKTIPQSCFPTCNAYGQVADASGLRFSLKFERALGSGIFGRVDAFLRKTATEERIVALKRPRHPKVELLLEALVQWRLQQSLEEYNIGFCIPEVYDIFREQRTGSVWFTMKTYNSCPLSTWILKPSSIQHFGALLLQLALVLEVLETEFMFDHRDLKVDNLLIVESPVDIGIDWQGSKRTIHFPFHIVLIDFGFSCQGGFLDVRAGEGLPPVDPCPKAGRDLFQILVSLWSLHEVRERIDAAWTAWILRCLGVYAAWIHTHSTLDWMYTVTDQLGFAAPQCAPSAVIAECMARLE